MTGLLSEIKAGKARLYLQFGGQGAPWYKELLKLYSDERLATFFEAALSAIDEERPRVEGSIGLPQGIDARKWLSDPTSVPTDDYLGCAAVSIPMIQVTQLAHVENLTQGGIPMADLIKNSFGSTGHSQGLIPACLMGMDKTGDDYYAALKKFVKYLLYLGVSAQKAFPYFEATEEEIELSKSIGGKVPSPMVAVLGESDEFIKKLMDQTNASLPEDKKIYISLFNNSTNRILSAHRSSLIEFHKQHKDYVDQKKFKYVYLRTSCPFHCSMLESIRDIFEPEIKHINFDFKGSDIKFPVYSFYDGADMRDSGANLAIKMYEDMAIHPLYWNKSVKPGLDESSVTHFIDFGPGKTSQRLSQDVMKDLGTEKPILGVAIPKELDEILGK